MNPDIFREYDIRGIAGKDITEEDVLLIGKATGTYFQQHGSSKIAVG
ncbi:MAG: phosphomannomutase, partial [Desulfosarcina sp.]|nr:phosphomannomutase [Desulfobacterales bacterium]